MVQFFSGIILVTVAADLKDTEGDGCLVLASISAQLAGFLWNILYLTRNMTQFIISEHKKVSHDIYNCSAWADFFMRSGSSC